MRKLPIEKRYKLLLDREHRKLLNGKGLVLKVNKILEEYEIEKQYRRITSKRSTGRPKLTEEEKWANRSARKLYNVLGGNDVQNKENPKQSRGSNKLSQKPRK